MARLDPAKLGTRPAAQALNGAGNGHAQAARADVTAKAAERPRSRRKAKPATDTSAAVQSLGGPIPGAGGPEAQRRFLEVLGEGVPEGSHLLVAERIVWVDKESGKEGEAFPAEAWREQLLTGPWYVSTGSSSRSRRRQRGDMTACRAIILDDIGTKIPAERITVEPTWKLETSAGNWQWGYLLRTWDDRIEMADDLMQALCDAGLQDTGVNTSCRLFRIPGSVNTKKGRGGFISRLHEADYERTFTLLSLARAFKVTPKARDKDEPGKGSRPAPTKDRIFDWLESSGHLGDAKGSGCWHIECPFPEEHSDERTDAWVMAATAPESVNRVFNVSCYHGHGRDDPSGYRKRFLSWVVDQGGPAEHDATGFQALLREIGAKTTADDPFNAEPEAGPDVVLDGEPEEVDLGAIPKQPDPHAFIVEDWLPDGVVTLFAAHGGAGKSYIALYIAICVAAGHEVLGVEVARRPVVFYSCEDDKTTLGYRVRRYCDMLKIEPSSLAGWLTLLDATASDNVLYTGDAAVGKRLTPRFGWLKARVAAAGAGLLVLDNASDAYDGNENERGKVRQFLTALRRVAPATLLLAHVDAVTSQQKGVGDGKGYSGSTGWHNSVRARWEGGGKRPGEMDLLLAKSNYGPTGLFAAFKYDKFSGVWVVGEVRARMVDSDEAMLPLLRLVKDYLGAGFALSESLYAPNGPGALLKLDGAPRGLKAKDVGEVLVRSAQRGYLRVESAKVDSKERRRYVLTEAGLTFTVGGEHVLARS